MSVNFLLAMLVLGVGMIASLVRQIAEGTKIAPICDETWPKADDMLGILGCLGAVAGIVAVLRGWL